jgi:chromosome partitioning protein
LIGTKGGELSFEVANEKEAMRIIPTKNYVVIDTPARPNSEDIKELANGCDLLILPTKPDIVSLEPMLETANDLSGAKFKALLTIVPPYPSKEGEVLKEELKKEGIPVFESMVRRTVGFEKAALAGVAINNLSDDRFSSAWQDYEELGKEILEELK